jgi:hypothetical protein
VTADAWAAGRLNARRRHFVQDRPGARRHRRRGGDLPDLQRP